MSPNSIETPSRFDRLRRAAGAVAFLALAALVVLLSAENRRLESALHLASQRSPGGLAVGDTLPAVEVADLDGRAATPLSAGESPSLLFFFTTTCSTCDQNLDSWLDLHRRYGDRYRVLGVGLDEPGAIRDYSESRGMPFEVVTVPDPLAVQALGLVGVPETLLVDPEGKVQARHLGVLPEDWDRDWLDG